MRRCSRRRPQGDLRHGWGLSSWPSRQGVRSRQNRSKWPPLRAATSREPCLVASIGPGRWKSKTLLSLMRHFRRAKWGTHRVDGSSAGPLRALRAAHAGAPWTLEMATRAARRSSRPPRRCSGGRAVARSGEQGDAGRRSPRVPERRSSFQGQADPAARARRCARTMSRSASPPRPLQCPCAGLIGRLWRAGSPATTRHLSNCSTAPDLIEKLDAAGTELHTPSRRSPSPRPRPGATASTRSSELSDA